MLKRMVEIVTEMLDAVFVFAMIMFFLVCFVIIWIYVFTLIKIAIF